MGLLDALQDKQFRSDVGGGLKDVLNRGVVGGLLGAPVDITTMALRPFGYKTENPVMGSEWIGKKMQDAGLVSGNRNHLAEMLAGFVDPATMATGAVKGAAMLPAMAGMFIGKGAKTWDVLQAQKALDMEKAGTTARQIWKETGTWKAPDGMWRQEIPDNLASITDSSTLLNRERVGIKAQLDKLVSDVKQSGGKPTDAQKFQANMLNMRHASTSYKGDVSSAFQHNDLYKAYPNIAKTDFQWTPMPVGEGAQYSPNEGILLNGGIFGKEAESLTGHELQHAIQHREGWATGGSPEAVFNSGNGVKGREEQFSFAKQAYEQSHQSSGDPLLSELFSDAKPWDGLTEREKLGWLDQGRNLAYQRLAGEAEARATQARIPLDAAQRRELFPEDSYDVPINQLIVRGLLK